MKHAEQRGVLPQQLNEHRKKVILMLRANAPAKLEKHVRPTYDRATGYPDGGVEPAFDGVGEVCSRCGQTRADVLETVEGKTCDAAAYRKWQLPLELGVSTMIGVADEARAFKPVDLATYARDPLAGVFA